MNWFKFTLCNIMNKSISIKNYVVIDLHSNITCE